MKNLLISILLLHFFISNANGQASNLVKSATKKTVETVTKAAVKKGVANTAVISAAGIPVTTNFPSFEPVLINSSGYPMNVPLKGKELSEIAKNRLKGEKENITLIKESENFVTTFYYQKLGSKQGFSNEDVKNLQKSLNSLNKSTDLKEDGLFGMKTIKSLNKYMDSYNNKN